MQNNNKANNNYFYLFIYLLLIYLANANLLCVHLSSVSFIIIISCVLFIIIVLHLLSSMHFIHHYRILFACPFSGRGLLIGSRDLI
jgi:hypothetical protein